MHVSYGALIERLQVAIEPAPRAHAALEIFDLAQSQQLQRI